MEKEIINRVAQSDLVTINLEDFYPKGERALFDLKPWLFEALILKEKDFREQIKNHDWSQYQNKFVAITCTADAIIPTWAFMLVASSLTPFTQKIVFGDLKKLDEQLFQEGIEKLNIKNYHDEKIIIRGCSHIDVPVSAYVELINRLRPVAKSIMYGDACSTVPLFKKSS
ncbi:MAG TPA: DUF2480 family protein [Bacteroidia bacterium]|nr:DUF2480 family protein [Bacteroidia bacterium]